MIRQLDLSKTKSTKTIAELPSQTFFFTLLDRSEYHNLQVRCFRHQLYRSVYQDLDVETEVVTICTCVVQGAGQIKEQGDRG